MNKDVLDQIKRLVIAVEELRDEVRRINEEGVVVVGSAGINEN